MSTCADLAAHHDRGRAGRGHDPARRYRRRLGPVRVRRRRWAGCLGPRREHRTGRDRRLAAVPVTIRGDEDDETHVSHVPIRYQSPDEDSARWDGFPFRAGDIVISTRSKSGTTWMQMICALLVFQDPGAAGARCPSCRPGSTGWSRRCDEVLARLAAQRPPPVHQDPHAARRHPARSRGRPTSWSPGTRWTWPCRCTTRATTSTASGSRQLTGDTAPADAATRQRHRCTTGCGVDRRGRRPPARARLAAGRDAPPLATPGRGGPSRTSCWCTTTTCRPTSTERCGASPTASAYRGAGGHLARHRRSSHVQIHAVRCRPAHSQHRRRHQGCQRLLPAGTIRVGTPPAARGGSGPLPRPHRGVGATGPAGLAPPVITRRWSEAAEWTST